jgi:hypothetical protein
MHGSDKRQPQFFIGKIGQPGRHPAACMYNVRLDNSEYLAESGRPEWRARNIFAAEVHCDMLPAILFNMLNKGPSPAYDMTFVAFLHEFPAELNSTTLYTTFMQLRNQLDYYHITIEPIRNN